jgi:integrase
MPCAAEPTDWTPVWHQLGVYPRMTLAEAREAAREALRALERGEHPRAIVEARRRAAAEAERETFKAVAERYIHHLQSSERPPRSSSFRMYRSRLNGHLYPELGERPIASITRKEVIAALDKVRENAGIASTRGTKSLLGAIMNWAANREIIAVNPAAGIKVQDIVGRAAAPRSRALKDAELAAVWRAIPAIGEAFAPIYKLLLLTGCRLAEIAGASWDEFEEDAGTLTIPAERSKNGLPMLVPLPPLAVDILKAVPRFTGKFIFSTNAGHKPVAAFSHAKGRLDAALAASGAQVDEFVVHDFRRTFRTGLAALGISRDVAEACLNHKKPGIIGTYDAHEYLPEKTDALRKWEARLLSIVEPPPDEPEQKDDSKVVPMRRSA